MKIFRIRHPAKVLQAAQQAKVRALTGLRPLKVRLPVDVTIEPHSSSHGVPTSWLIRIEGSQVYLDSNQIGEDFHLAVLAAVLNHWLPDTAPTPLDNDGQIR